MLNTAVGFAVIGFRLKSALASEGSNPPELWNLRSEPLQMSNRA